MKKKNVALRVVSVLVVLCIAAIAAYCCVRLLLRDEARQTRYDVAMELLSSGEASAAEELLREMGDYKDARAVLRRMAATEAATEELPPTSEAKTEGTTEAELLVPLTDMLIVAATLDDYPEAYLERGNPAGSAVSFAQHVARGLNCDLRMRQVDVDDMQALLRSGAVDAALVSRAESRSLSGVALTDSQVVERLCVVVHASSDITSISDLEGAAVGAIIGSDAQERLLRDESVEAFTFSNASEGVQLLLDRELEAVVADEATARAMVRENEAFAMLKESYFEARYLFALPNDEALDTWNRAIEE